MKPSKYNFTWPGDSPDTVMVFNSLTTALAEVKKGTLELLNVPQFEYQALPDSTKLLADGLKQGGFILEDSADELKILKYAYYSNKYNAKGLGLTIAPTMRCNFACTYCYEQAGGEQDRGTGQNKLMPESVQQKLLEFIERAAKTVKNVSVTWYGGEPLLARDLIFDLSQKIIAITEENNISYSAHMVTNGYLLSADTDILQKMKDSRIKSVQITLDGPPEIHDSRRMLKGSGGPTFDRIMEGIRLLHANELRVNLRVNVDRSNMNETEKLLDILKSNKLNDLNVYIAQVSLESAGCKSMEGSCTTIEEFSKINQEFCQLVARKGFKTDVRPSYPSIAFACCAGRTNAYLIDPDGDMYKCWHEIGQKVARIGNITELKQRTKSERMHEIRWMTWEPFEYVECMSCKVMPICMGGCGYQAMFGNTRRLDCAEWKYSLEHYVRERYKREKARQKVVNGPQVSV